VEGAEAGFAFVAGNMDDHPGGQDVPDVRAIGDQTDATRSADVELESGDPWQRLELAFRLGKLVASVDVIDYRNVEPELAVAELLAEALLTKIERVQAEGTPGLSPRALRLAPLASWIEANRLRDFYVRVGGRDEPTFAQMVAALRDGGTAPTGTPAPSRGFVRPSDTYMFWTPVGEGDPLKLPLYVVWLDRYASSQQAASAVRALSSDLGSGYFDVQEFLSAEHIGDQSREFAYRFEGDASGTARGHLVVARVGEFVVRTQVDGPRGVQAAGVRELAAVQVACLLQEGACAPMSHLVASAALVAEPGAR
jgi:hypothetical protein